MKNGKNTEGPAEKILILALSGIGDALMFTPALSLLRKYRPGARIEAVVMYKGVEDIYRRTGLLDTIYHFDFLERGAPQSLRFVLGMRGRCTHSISVYPANRREYNVMNFLFGAAARGGVTYKRQNARNFGFLNTVTVNEDDTLHNARENINLIKKMFGIETDEEPGLLFKTTAEDEQFAAEMHARLSMPQGAPLVGFHAGCSTLKNHINRRWEPHKFAALAKRLIAEKGATVLLFGGPEETELKNTIVTETQSDRIFKVHSQNLAQAAALIGKCDVFVTNDSSLMHVAAAMKRKVVAVIGPTNTHYIHPWKTEHSIVSLNLDCAPCFFYSPKPLSCSRTDVQYKCVRELETDAVYSAVCKMLTGE